MVKRPTTRIGVYCGILALGVALLWVLIPSWEVEVSNPDSRLLRDAIMSYQIQTGEFARLLTEVEPFLELLTDTDCVITQENASRYEVIMPIAGGKTYFMQVTYAVGRDGQWEDYNVDITRTVRTR